MNKGDIINTLKAQLPFLKKQFYVTEIGLFGSFIKQEENEGSDIDILVELEDEYNDLFNFIRLKNYLEELFHTEVDLVMKEGIKPRLKESILREVVYV
ncbi:MAG: nucleotidyltransferase family protein [Planctomycetes bacterium]|nr:nucleotidyltransferase family protein [Planctomycetota bacterium]